MHQQPDTPPKLATWFLYRFLRQDLAEDVSGDLAERYHAMKANGSTFRAKLDYWYQVVAYVRPFAIRKFSYHHQNHAAMYRSYFIISLRAMRKNKLHAIINVAGLSLGMAVAMIIGLWIKDELSYEKNFDRYEKTGRVLQHVTNNGEVSTWWSVPWPLAEELRKKYGENFTHVVLTTSPEESVVSYENKHLTQTGMFAEPGFTDLFTLKVVRGSENALSDLSSMLISESLARIYFEDDDPIGKIMTINNNITVHVAGVFRDIPEQSELNDVHFVAPWQLLYTHAEWIRNMYDPWRPNAFCLYVGLADNHSFEQVSATIKDAKIKNLNAELAKKKPELFIHPMSRWHLYSSFKDGRQDGGLITYVWLFAIIAVFVVLMACINFMNLNTARSEKRAREVGIRKAIGSYRGQLIQQFFSESVLTALVSFIISLLLVQLSLPLFNIMAGKHTVFPWSDLMLWGYAISLFLFIGVLAGSYPALYLSSITPRKALKGAFKASKTSAWSRKVMVVMQFTISVVMIIGTAVVFQQIQHAKDRPVGYNTDGLISVQSNTDQLHKHINAVRYDLQQAGVISDVAEADVPTTESWSSSSAYSWNGKDPNLSIDFANIGISHSYGKTIGWDIAQGRDFNQDILSDSVAFVINEAAAEFMGFKNPVGETIHWYEQPFQVVGVVRNIVARSPFRPVIPTIYYINSGPGNVALFRIKPDQSIHKALVKIEDVYKKYNPDQPFNFQFIDQVYALKFADEERVGKLAGVFTSLAIFISCLGIFGLSSFIAEQRTKEIGIRKVHGATILQVWRMVSVDFIILVFIACCMALPLAYQFASQWVSRYDYRVSMSWLIPLYATVGILIITLITVSWHTVQAARMNPVNSLRAE